MARVVVYHGGYGCETGCCGHYVEVDGENDYHFQFDHPNFGEDTLAFARRMVEESFGKDHCHDLDWESCVIDDW